MNRHRSYGARDDQPVDSGDAFFLGVNARLDPCALSPGEVAHAVNCRFDEGRAATRRGIRIMPWGAQGYQFQNPDLVLPYGSSVRLAETYSDPITGQEWLVIVTNNGVYKARPGSTGSPIPVGVGLSTSTATDLIQTYTGLVMLRGPDNPPLYMRAVDEGWRALPAADPGKEALPPSSVGIYFQNRLCVVDQRGDAAHSDSVWVGDFGAGGSTLQGEDIYQAFKINQGSNDRLVAVAKFNETTLVCAKEKSVYVVSNIYGDNQTLSENIRLDEVTHEYGCRAPRSFVQVGKDLWFLAHRRGISSLRQTETNALQGVDIPVSRDIQPIIERINWEHADGVVAACHGNRVFFAVPLDGATYNNAVLVYSTLNQKWAGYDSGPAVKVRDWVTFTYAGEVRLGFVSTDGFVCLYEDGYVDDTGDTEGNLTHHAIESVVRTRAYLGDTGGNKKFQWATCRLATWYSDLEVSLIPRGQGEGRVLLSRTVDNTQYIRPHGQAPWDPVNGAGDWDMPWREDYSLEAADTQVTDAGGAGTVAFDILQETEDVWKLSPTRDHGAQIEITSSRGRTEVCGILLAATRGSTRAKTHA